jgi:membrane associated rhomboid family serine protease
MGTRKNENRIARHIRIALGVVALLWFVHALNYLLIMDLRFYGIHPRRIHGLWGIIYSPFLHGNLQHLIANSGALFVLLTMSLSFNRKLTVVACIAIALLGGSLVWLCGRGNTVHIGASGIIFGLIGFLMCLGVFRKDWKAFILSVIVFLLYGGALFTLFSYTPGISWSGHFFGLLSGMLVAWWTRKEKM